MTCMNIGDDALGGFYFLFVGVKGLLKVIFDGGGGR